MHAIAPFLVFGLIVVAVNFLAIRQRAKEKQRPKTLSELGRFVGHEWRRECVDLLERDTVTFDSITSLESRLDHRLEDPDGGQLGSAIQQPRPGFWEGSNGRPSRFKTIRVEISDQRAVRLQIVRKGGWVTPPLEVRDGAGRLIGSISGERSRRFAIESAAGVRIGTIERTSRGEQVDYAVYDETGLAVATISDFRQVARRFPDSPDRQRLMKLLGRWGQPDEHVVEVTSPVSPELRMLVLGAAAAVYLTLQYPHIGDA